MSVKEIRKLFPYLLCFALLGCSSSQDPQVDNQEIFESAEAPLSQSEEVTPSAPNAVQSESAKQICNEALTHLRSLSGGQEIQIQLCEAQSDGNGQVAMVFQLNDYLEWSTLLGFNSSEDIIFTLPLGLVAYAFGGSGVNPSVFDLIILTFDDDAQTVYAIQPIDLEVVLNAQTKDQAEAALLKLRDQMNITTLR